MDLRFTKADWASLNDFKRESAHTFSFETDYQQPSSPVERHIWELCGSILPRTLYAQMNECSPYTVV